MIARLQAKNADDRPLVFLLEPVRLDVTSAERHGRLVTMYETHFECPSPFKTGFSICVLARLQECGYLPQRDFILVCGGQTYMTALSAAVSANYGYMRALVWNSKEEARRYDPIWMGQTERLSESLLKA